MSSFTSLPTTVRDYIIALAPQSFCRVCSFCSRVAMRAVESMAIETKRRLYDIVGKALAQRRRRDIEIQARLHGRIQVLHDVCDHRDMRITRSSEGGGEAIYRCGRGQPTNWSQEASRRPFWSISAASSQIGPRMPPEGRFGAFQPPAHKLAPGGLQNAVLQHFSR